MAADIYRHGQPRHVSRHGLNIYGKGRCPASESLGSYAQQINFPKHIFLQPSIEFILVPLVDRPQQSVLCQGGHFVKGTAYTHSHHYGRAGIGSGGLHRVHHETLHALHAVGGL